MGKGQAVARAAGQMIKVMRPALNKLGSAATKTGKAMKSAARSTGKTAKSVAKKNPMTKANRAARAEKKAIERAKQMAMDGPRGKNPLDRLPRNARREPFPPSSDPMRPQRGFKYKWEEGGRKFTVYGHPLDQNAARIAPGSNSGTGSTYRVLEGNRHFDGAGNLHSRGALNPNGNNFDPNIANNTHIKWPGGHTMPTWSGTP